MKFIVESTNVNNHINNANNHINVVAPTALFWPTVPCGYDALRPPDRGTTCDDVEVVRISSLMAPEKFTMKTVLAQLAQANRRGKRHAA